MRFVSTAGLAVSAYSGYKMGEAITAGRVQYEEQKAKEEAARAAEEARRAALTQEQRDAEDEAIRKQKEERDELARQSLEKSRDEFKSDMMKALPYLVTFFVLLGLIALNVYAWSKKWISDATSGYINRVLLFPFYLIHLVFKVFKLDSWKTSEVFFSK